MLLDLRSQNLIWNGEDKILDNWDNCGLANEREFVAS